MDAGGDDDEPLRTPSPAVPRGRRGPSSGRLIAPGGRRPHQPRRNDVLESMQAMSLLTIMEIVGPVLLLAVLIYGTVQESDPRETPRRRGP